MLIGEEGGEWGTSKGKSGAHQRGRVGHIKEGFFHDFENL
jgi:hypothetical protein